MAANGGSVNNRNETSDVPSRTLGAEVRRLREAAGLTGGRLGYVVGLGDESEGTSSSKSAMSRIETDQRFVDDALLEKLALALHVRVEHLLQFASPARSSRRVNRVEGEADPQSDAANDDPPAETRIRRSRGRLVERSALVVLSVAVIVLLGLRFWPDTPSQRSMARLATPVNGSTVEQQISVRGSSSGYQDYDLWLDVRGNAGDPHHPSDRPCIRRGSQFSFTPYYVGQVPPKDNGRSFTISVLAVKRDSAAEQFLFQYANRPADAHQYDGIKNLHSGILTVDSIAVARAQR